MARQRYQEKKGIEKENRDGECPNMMFEGTGLGIILLEDFLALLRNQGDSLKLDAYVNINSIDPDQSLSSREQADHIAKLIWDMMGYRWL